MQMKETHNIGFTNKNVYESLLPDYSDGKYLMPFNGI